MRALAISLRTISSPFKFTPHIMGHTLQRLQLFVPTKLSQRPHAMLKSFKNVV